MICITLVINIGISCTGYEVLLPKYDSHYGACVHTVGLKDLRSLSDVFRMTDYNTDFPSSSAVSNLHPILTRTWNYMYKEEGRGGEREGGEKEGELMWYNRPTCTRVYRIILQNRS